MLAWFAYQLHRASWAFDHDGGAFVQGLSASITAAVTSVLCWVTWRYVRLTKRMLEASEAQLRAAFLPALTATFHPDFQKPGNVVMGLSNTGEVPVWVRKAMVAGKLMLRDPDKPLSYKAETIALDVIDVREWRTLVMRPNEHATISYKPVPKHSSDQKVWEEHFNALYIAQDLEVEVSDITGRIIYSVHFARNIVSNQLQTQYRLFPKGRKSRSTVAGFFHEEDAR